MPLALAQDAQPVVLLRHVHEVEVGGERADDETGLVEAQPFRTLEKGLAFRPEVARPSALRA